MATPGETPLFEKLVVDGAEVPAALLVQFLTEAAAEEVDITDFSAALAPGQASGLLAWAQANGISFEALLKVIAAELRAAGDAAGEVGWSDGVSPS